MHHSICSHAHLRQQLAYILTPYHAYLYGTQHTPVHVWIPYTRVLTVHTSTNRTYVYILYARVHTIPTCIIYRTHVHIPYARGRTVRTCTYRTHWYKPYTRVHYRAHLYIPYTGVHTVHTCTHRTYLYHCPRAAAGLPYLGCQNPLWGLPHPPLASAEPHVSP